MALFLVANDDSRLMRRIGHQAPLSVRLSSLVAALALIIFSVSVSSHPSAAQECHNCKIPSGYTTLKGNSGGGCVNKLVKCTCTVAGKDHESSQEMCLYKVSVGGNLQADKPASPPATK